MAGGPLKATLAFLVLHGHPLLGPSTQSLRVLAAEGHHEDAKVVTSVTVMASCQNPLLLSQTLRGSSHRQSQPSHEGNILLVDTGCLLDSAGAWRVSRPGCTMLLARSLPLPATGHGLAVEPPAGLLSPEPGQSQSSPAAQNQGQDQGQGTCTPPSWGQREDPLPSPGASLKGMPAQGCQHTRTPGRSHSANSCLLPQGWQQMLCH